MEFEHDGKTWKLDVSDKPWRCGEVSYENRTVHISPSFHTNVKDLLETSCHETAHMLFPYLSEETVAEAGPVFAFILTQIFDIKPKRKFAKRIRRGPPRKKESP